MPQQKDATIITFDIHGVLFKTDYKKIIFLILKNRAFLRTICSIRLIIKSIRLLHQQRKTVGEAFLMTLAAKHQPLAKHLPFIIRLINTQKPIPSTINIVKRLKSQGYTLHILSNIGEQIFADLKRHFFSLFNLFDDYTVATSQKGYIGKPDPNMFENYLSNFNRENKQIIFIDDKQRNLNTAKQFGITCIHYQSPEQLEETLAALNIIPS